MRFGERFLTTGDLPEPAAPAWGDAAVALELPGGPYLVAGLAPAQAAALARRFGAGCAQPPRGGGATPHLAVRRAPAGAFLAVDTRGWEYTLDLAPGAGELRLAGLGLAARVSGARRERAVLWVADEGDGTFAGSCENVLRVLVAHRLLTLGGLMLHAAGVAEGGAAVVAMGRSGAGKSTFARCAAARGAEVLSDDLVALLPTSGVPRVAALPFTGDLPAAPPAARPVPLAGLLRLEQHPADTLQALGAAEGLATLLACTPVVNVDPWRRDDLLAAATALRAAAPAPGVWALRCTPSGGWRLAATLLAPARSAALAC